MAAAGRRLPGLLRPAAAAAVAAAAASAGRALGTTALAAAPTRARATAAATDAHEHTRQQYLDAQGCERCLTEGNYECPDRALCSEPHTDRVTLHAVREHLLDIADLRSSRDKVEFLYPDAGGDPSVVDLSSWPAYLKSRGYPLSDLPRTARHLSRGLTYPLTLAQFLLVPTQYELTEDGSSAFAALSHRLLNAVDDPLRICVVGARAEAWLPPRIWAELAILCPDRVGGQHFEIVMVGPELPQRLHNTSVEGGSQLILSFKRKHYHEVHDELMMKDEHPDLYVAFNSGLGHAAYSAVWPQTLQYLLETHKPLILTSNSAADAESDIAALEQTEQPAWDYLVRPSLNIFRSLRCDVHPQSVRELVWANHSVMVVHGR